MPKMEKMDVDLQKSSEFIRRLLGNPSLQGYTPMQREEQIIQFLGVNSSQLYPTLSSAGFFPGRKWGEIYLLLLKSLYMITDEEYLPILKNLIYDLDLSFISFLRHQNMPLQEIKAKVFGFVKELLKKHSARKSFPGILGAVKYGFIDRYIEEIFASRKYVHFELTKVQRLKMSKNEIRNMLKLSMILKPIVFLLPVSDSRNQHEVSAGLVQNRFAEKVFQVVRDKLSVIPEQVLKSAINSNVSFIENRFIEATARITTLLSARCRGFVPGIKTDRGADTADKSWFSIARRNYKYYGYDVKMLDAFYNMASENRW